MKWCQTCKTEYEDFATKCSDCGGILVSADTFMNANKSESTNSDSLVHLRDDQVDLTVVYTSTLESDILMVSEFLNENGIVFEIKNEGIGSYLQIYGGVNYLGTAICVDIEDAEKAKALIDAFWKNSEPLDFSEQPTEFESDSVDLVVDSSIESEDYRVKYEKSMKLRRNLMRFLIVFILGSGLFFQLLSFLTQ